MNKNRRIVRKLADMLSPLSNHTVGKLASILIRTELKKNDRLPGEEKISNQLYYVDTGMVRQFYLKEGKDLTEHFSYEGDVFMNIESYLLRQPAELMIEALEPTVLYGIPREPLAALLDDYPDIGRMYGKFIEFILVSVQRKINFFRFEAAHARYDRLLKDHPEIIRRVPLVHIASYLWMSPETLSRVRAAYPARRT